jgi:glycosyltransferase involved in cell wall biosynthesis
MRSSVTARPKLKIAYVIDALHTDGAGTESQLRLLIEGMRARGHTVVLYVLRHTSFSADCDYPCEIRSAGFYSFFSLKSWRDAWQFRRAMIDQQFDVVHGFFNDVALLLPIILSFSKIRRFTSRRDMGIWYTWANLWVLRINALTRCKVISNSLAVLEHTKEREWLTPDRLFCVYNALHSKSGAQSESAIQLQAQIAASPAIAVGLVANIKPIKQIETLVNAAAEIKKQTQAHIDYHVIGAIADTAYAHEIQVLIEQHGLSDCFFMHGAIANVREVLQSFDIGVLSSASEGLSNTALEYLQAGLATVLSNTGGNPEIVTHGKNGLLFTPGDPHELAVQLKSLIEDAALRAQLGQAATASAERFSQAAMCETYAGIYTEKLAHWQTN